MGAEQFFHISYGKSAADAFHNAVEEASWEYGHGGYTGTIAEKHDFVLFEFPPRTDPYKVEGAVHGAASALTREDSGGERVHYHPNVDRAQVRKWQTQEKRDLKWLRERIGDRQTRRLIEIADDKWGPAACIEVKGKKAVELKERRGLKGTHNKVFIFFGWASS